MTKPPQPAAATSLSTTDTENETPSPWFPKKDPSIIPEPELSYHQLYPDPLIPHDDEYLCCCGCCQIYCGTTTLALFHYLCICLCLIFELSSGGKYGFSLLRFLILGCNCLHYLSIVLLFIGLSQKRSSMLLPYIIFGYILVGLYIFAWIFLTAIIILAEPEYLRRIIGKYEFQILTIKLILFIKSSLIFLGMALVQVWWNWVVQSCRKYFHQMNALDSERRDYRNRSNYQE